MKEFAENLKRFRRENHISQNQLANMSSISIKTLQNYEQDRNGGAPTLYNLMVLADIFNVSPYCLYYGGQKEMQTNSLYMNELLSELEQLSSSAIHEIHDSEATGVNVPKLSLSEEVFKKIKASWNKKIPYSKRGFYKPYVEQTITRYSQNRQFWKNKFHLG